MFKKLLELFKSSGGGAAKHQSHQTDSREYVFYSAVILLIQAGDGQHEPESLPCGIVGVDENAMGILLQERPAPLSIADITAAMSDEAPERKEAFSHGLLAVAIQDDTPLTPRQDALCRSWAEGSGYGVDQHMNDRRELSGMFSMMMSWALSDDMMRKESH